MFKLNLLCTFVFVFGLVADVQATAITSVECDSQIREMLTTSVKGPPSIHLVYFKVTKSLIFDLSLFRQSGLNRISLFSYDGTHTESVLELDQTLRIKSFIRNRNGQIIINNCYESRQCAEFLKDDVQRLKRFSSNFQEPSIEKTRLECLMSFEEGAVEEIQNKLSLPAN